MALTNFNAAVAWTLQSVNNAQNGRFHIGAFIPSAAATTGMTAWRDGVIVSTNNGGSSNIPNDLQIKAVTPTPSLSLTVEAGHCVITRSGNGPYLCYVQTQGTLTIANADTVNPRIDRIVAQVYDSALGDTLPSTPALSAPGALVIRAVTGTPAGSPSAPATPPGAISLATVAVAANATQITNANITDTRRSANNPGGARPLLPGDATSDAGTVAGDLTYRTASAGGGTGVWTWTGTRWKSLGIPTFTSVAARDSEITAPLTGELALTTDYYLTWVYGGSFWFSREDQLIGWGQRTTTTSNSASTAAVGALRVDNLVLVAGWPVRIEYQGHANSSAGADNFRAEIRYKVGGTAGTGDAIAFASQTFAPVGHSRTWSTIFIPPSTGTYSFLLTFARDSGSGNCNFFADTNRGLEMKIWRCRTDITDTGVDI